MMGKTGESAKFSLRYF